VDIGEILRWSIVVNVFLVGAVVSLPIVCFLWGLSIGKRVAEGVPLTALGGTAGGDIFQAGAPEVGSGQDPLAFLDEHISRATGAVGGKFTPQKVLLDPALAGQTPEQAR